MTPEQIKLMRHALGLPNDRMQSYRNRYFAANGSPQAIAWDDLVSRGMAERQEAGSVRSFYCVTLAGAKRAIDPAETLDGEDFPAVTPQENP